MRFEIQYTVRYEIGYMRFKIQDLSFEILRYLRYKTLDFRQ